jgi:autotransporter-associated beta strand protein
LNKTGAGTLTLTGPNGYTGGTTISSGTLQLGNSGTSGSILGNVADNGTLVFNRSDVVTFAGVIFGTGGVAQVGVGTTILTAANTYTGGTTISAGTLELGNGGTSGSVLGNIIDNAALVVDHSNTVTLPGVISGTGSVSQIGPGTTILTAANTYTGATTISAGTLQLGNGGTSGSILGNVLDNGTLAFNRSDTATFAGVVSGTGGLVQMGPGTTVLTANHAYTGGTTISAGALQLGNGGTTGSILGNVTDNGSLLFDRSDNVTFNAKMSGSGNLVQNGSGTTILGGINTYSGGTIVNSGTLLVNSSQALGLGNVVVNGGVLGADPQPINVKGNYTQNAGGTLQLNVAGPASGQYDVLNVGGNASLNGTLRLQAIGYVPTAGDLLKLVSTGGVVSGRFAQFGNPFSTRPDLNTINLIYGKNFVELQFLNLTTPVSPAVPTVPSFPSPPLPPTFPPGLLPKVIETVNFTPLH